MQPHLITTANDTSHRVRRAPSAPFSTSLGFPSTPSRRERRGHALRSRSCQGLGFDDSCERCLPSRACSHKPTFVVCATSAGFLPQLYIEAVLWRCPFEAITRYNRAGEVRRSAAGGAVACGCSPFQLLSGA